MITVRDVSKRFYNMLALNNVSLEIKTGEVIGIVGPNGAGKTTLLKIIAGLLQPDAGAVRTTLPAWPAIGYKPERLLFPGHLTVRRYLRLVAGVANVPRTAVAGAIGDSLALVGLAENADKPIKDCSKGMRQRLGVAQALLGRPPLLLFDEPSNALDPAGQTLITGIIKSLHEVGYTILLNSHRLEEVTAVCSRLVILNEGQIRYESDMAEALRIRPHAIIVADRDLDELRPLLQSLHTAVRVNGRTVHLEEEAMGLRPHILSIMLSTGVDIVQVAQKRVTLAEIYAEAMQ